MLSRPLTYLQGVHPNDLSNFWLIYAIIVIVFLSMVILQKQGLTIGSGSVESTIKQIGRRVKISGAQWHRNNVAQVLKHRCAYLNGYFYSPKYFYSVLN
ncbi:MAG: hypothetical protein ACK54G_01965 [Pseudanabaena sp.]